MRRAKLGVIVVVVAAVVGSWGVRADAKGGAEPCTGGSANAAQCDLDGDGVVNKDDDDIDGDGVANDADRCPRDAADTCEPDEDPGPDPTGGLPGLEDLPLPDDVPGLDDLPPVEPPPVTAPPIEPPPVTVPPVEPPGGIPPVEPPPVTVPPLPEVPPVA